MKRLAGFMFSLTVMAATPAVAAEFYSNQVRAVPMAKKADGMATYRVLREKGYLTYAYQVEIDGAAWLRIADGYLHYRIVLFDPDYIGKTFTAARIAIDGL